MELTSSELGYWICASFQHLRAFSLKAENIDEFEVTMLAGQLAVFLNAARGRGKIGMSEINRIAKAQKIGRRVLMGNLLPIVDRLKHDRIAILYREDKVVGIEENLIISGHLFEVVGKVWETLDPSLIERGAIYVLKHTYALPRTWSEELDLLSEGGFRDSEAESTLGVSTSFRIVQSFETPKLADSFLFNPYVWRANQNKISHALAYMKQDEKEAVKRCIESVAACQALPLNSLRSDPNQLKTAQAVGLLDFVEVNTAAGDRKKFVFTPHLTTHPDARSFADDLLNDVRAILACVSYGEYYSRISRLGGHKREKTINYLRKLLRNKVAGDATAIGVDYQLLEERGIISVEPTETPPGGRFQMRLLRENPLKIALTVIEEASDSPLSHPQLVHTKTLDPASMFVNPEETRVTAGQTLGEQPEEVKEARIYFLKKIRKEIF
jgi:hypothetical protein